MGPLEPGLWGPHGFTSPTILHNSKQEMLADKQTLIRNAGAKVQNINKKNT